MKTNTPRLTNNSIGQVFTPLKWTEWLINKWNIFEAWLDGAHICDPTAGEGAFPLAMLHIARQKGIAITPERLSRLTLIEIVPSHLERFRENVKREFGIDFPTSQIFCQDVIMEAHAGKYDILVGNPPWVNFGDLPTGYKARVQPFFLEEGLVPDRQKNAPRFFSDGYSSTGPEGCFGKIAEKERCWIFLPAHFSLFWRRCP